MYADFFGFRELPFNNTPDPRFFYSTPDHEEALASLIYATTQRKGFVLLTGEVGAGKTLLTRLLIRHFGQAVAYANINHVVESPGSLMEAICTEFELDFDRSDSETHLVRILHDFLLERFAQNTPVVLVLDEAQSVSFDAFERLRMIGNLESDDAKLLQVAIVGQPELQQMFAKPNLRQMRQRIFRSFHLPALDRETTEKYILHRLGVVTEQGEGLFSNEAIEKIFESSSGIPRVVNTICDNTLLSAYSADRRKIDATFVESVIEQMMLIPEHQNQTFQTQPAVSGDRKCAATTSTQRSLSLESRTRQLVNRAFGQRVSASKPSRQRPDPNRMHTIANEIHPTQRITEQNRVAQLEAELIGMIQKMPNPSVLLEAISTVNRAASTIAGQTDRVSDLVAQCEQRARRVEQSLESVTDDLQSLRTDSHVPPISSGEDSDHPVETVQHSVRAGESEPGASQRLGQPLPALLSRDRCNLISLQSTRSRLRESLDGLQTELKHLRSISASAQNGRPSLPAKPTGVLTTG